MTDPFRDTASSITDDRLTELYDDLDTYKEVNDALIERNISLTEELTRMGHAIRRARELHRENCIVAKAMVDNAFRCSMCDTLAGADKEGA